ncbi:MAG: hypothetical protein K9N51_09065 [Candidatus Pacebacteria bacterium]|nr:hypothetical protein [Candidatus Paceibacterota bacterium]
MTVDMRQGKVRAVYGDGWCLHVEQRWLAEGTEEATPVEVEVVQEARDMCLPTEGISWVECSTDETVLFESAWRLSGEAMEFSVRITNRGTDTVALCLEQSIAGIPLRGMCFAPSLRSDYDLKRTGAAFSYRGAPGLTKGLPGGTLSIPMVCFYEREQDVGFTVAAHIEAPTHPFGCETNVGQVSLQRRAGITPGHSATIRHFIIRHEGCWRPGLRWVRDAYSEYFMTSADTVDATHGCFVYTNTATPELCDKLVRQGVKNVEIHWTCPFFGKVVPEEEPWVKMVDDKWNTIKRTTDPDAPAEDAPYKEIKRYVANVTNPSGRREGIHAFIRELQRRGMQAFMYFNPTECWESFATQEFPESIIRRSDGAPRMTWFDHVIMDCRPDSRWGQYLRGEMRQLLEIYPEIDGIFMDQSALDPEDFRVCGITDAIAKIVERTGKTCYWNGPYMVDLMQHAVGLLGELGPVQGELIKWLTIGNKVCCGLGHTEAQYQRNLLNGLWPSAPSLTHARGFRVSDIDAHTKAIPEELQAMHNTYMELYESFPGKRWFLGANPLDVPEGVQGNIFETREGTYLIPLIVPGHGIENGPAITNAEITVRVPDDASIRAACVRSVNVPDGPYRVQLRRHPAPDTRPGQLRVTIPWLGSACLLVLTRDEENYKKMPPPPNGVELTKERPLQIICASACSEGVAPTGNRDSIENGLETSASLPSVPTRKVSLNGYEVGTLGSVNSWHWHGRVRVVFDKDITGIPRRKNELIIEPDGPEDFFKLRNISMLVVYSDGRVFHSQTDPNTYSSCPHAEAEGIIQSPIRIPIDFPELPDASSRH